jgi:hypothetical protein
MRFSLPSGNDAMKAGLTILLAFVLLAVPRLAGAAVTFSLAPAAQNPARATQAVFTGTLTNTSATEKVFLNNLQATFTGGAGAVLALEPNTFFANVPGILLPGETYTGVLLRMEINATAAPGNYTGTIIVKGGADILAGGDLASAPLAILSPFVSIVATDASASEFGPDPGIVTITRTGSTSLPLPVSYTLSGSAGNSAYTAIPASPVVAAGAASVTISITPIPDNIAQGDRIATLSLAPSATFTPGATVAASVTIHDKPADQWRWEKFGAAANDPGAQDLADWEGDGIKNLVEYGLNLDPKTATANSLAQPDTSTGYLTYSYVPNPAATDLTYTVEASTDLAAWSTAHVETVVVANPIPPNRVTVRYNIPIPSLERVFFRLRITRLGVSP